jgi:hypothetical protein
MAETRVVEVRIYRLMKGSGDRFHQLVHEQSIPMVKASGHEVLAYGPSCVDSDVYFLMRAYISIDRMRADQNAFYESDAWRNGPREAIVSLIEEQSEVVFELTPESIEALKFGFIFMPIS